MNFVSDLSMSTEINVLYVVKAGINLRIDYRWTITIGLVKYVDFFVSNVISSSSADTVSNLLNQYMTIS